MSITSRLFATEDAVERWFAENDPEAWRLSIRSPRKPLAGSDGRWRSCGTRNVSNGCGRCENDYGRK